MNTTTTTDLDDAIDNIESNLRYIEAEIDWIRGAMADGDADAVTQHIGELVAYANGMESDAEDYAEAVESES